MPSWNRDGHKLVVELLNGRPTFRIDCPFQAWEDRLGYYHTKSNAACAIRDTTGKTSDECVLEYELEEITAEDRWDLLEDNMDATWEVSGPTEIVWCMEWDGDHWDITIRLDDYHDWKERERG